MTAHGEHDHAEHDHVVAVFPDRSTAEAAVDELRGAGLGSEHLGVAVRSDDPVAFEHDDDADAARETGLGTAVGVPLGALAGLAVVGAATAGVGVGGVLAMAGAGALWGVVLGGTVGMARAEESWEQHEELALRALAPGEVMVVVCTHGRPHTVTDVLIGHGGRLQPAP